MTTKIYILAVLIFITMACGGIAKGATDREVVAATLIAEAGGEEANDMVAVMNVIHNRSINRKKTHRQVCLQKWQFSCWNGKNVDQVVSKAKNHKKWDQALSIVDSNARGELKQLVGKSDHYHVYKGENKVSPKWSHPDYGGCNDKARVKATIGHHVFMTVK